MANAAEILAVIHIIDCLGLRGCPPCACSVGNCRRVREAAVAILDREGKSQSDLRTVVEAAKDLNENMQGEWRYPARDRLQAALDALAASTKKGRA